MNIDCSYIIPARISCYILGVANYYIENEEPLQLKSGKKAIGIGENGKLRINLKVKILST
jgi:hypothetical protein